MNHANHVSRTQNGNRLSWEPIFNANAAFGEFLGNDLETTVLGIETLLGFTLSLELPEDLDVGSAIEEDAQTGCEFCGEVFVEEDV